MSRRIDVRIEDVMMAAITIVFLATGATTGRLAEGRWWEYSFIIFPSTLIILALSIRYAVGGGAIGTALSGVGSVLRDWLPFALFLAVYETVRSRVWASMVPRELDATLLHIDRMIFGETPAVMLERWISPAATGFLAFCYLLHLLLPPVMAFFWYLRDRQVFRELLLAVLACGAIGTAGYLAVPAVGPEAAFPELFKIPLENSRAMDAVAMMDTARAPHDVFPSLHVAISAVLLWFAWRYGRWMFWIFLPFIVGNWISTLYLRYHYGIDDLVGFVLAVASVWLARVLLAIELRWRQPAASQAVVGRDSPGGPAADEGFSAAPAAGDHDGRASV